MHKFTLAFKYFLKRKVTYFAILAVTLCVFIVTIVMTVMTGLVGDFKQKNHDFTGDCVVGTDSLVGFAYYEDFMEILTKQKEIAAISPVIKSFALLRNKNSKKDNDAEIMGIDPLLHSKVTNFSDTLFYNNEDVSKSFELAYDPNLAGCIIGSSYPPDREAGLLDRNYVPRMSYSINCVPLTSKGAFAQAGTDIIDTKTFYLSDLSNSGLPRIDGYVVYVPFEDAQKLCGMAGSTKRISRIYIKFADTVKLKEGTRLVHDLWDKYKLEKQNEKQAYLLDTVSVQNWKQFRRESISSMENEQNMMTLMFGFVGITTVFIVLVVFYMIISHKSKDIGILKSIGASNKDIIELFSFFAFLIGFFSSVIGLLAGWLFLVNINRLENWLYVNHEFQLWNRNIFAIGGIPNSVNFTVLAIITASAIAACLIGAFVPSFQAAIKRPADILQVNQL